MKHFIEFDRTNEPADNPFKKRMTLRFRDKKTFYHDVLFTRDGKFMLIYGPVISLWDLDAMEEKWSVDLPVELHEGSTARISLDGSWVVTVLGASGERTILWDGGRPTCHGNRRL